MPHGPTLSVVTLTLFCWMTMSGQMSGVPTCE